MIRALVFALGLVWGVCAQAFTISLSSNDFLLSPIYSDVRFFSVSIDIDERLDYGNYVNPRINRITYRVRGNLAPGVRSGFPDFDLSRRIVSGRDFYRQGGYISFSISRNAIFRDGIQLYELAGLDNIFTFDAREVGSGRFHPMLLVINGDGTGYIQNSNNVPRLTPRISIDFGDEYWSSIYYDQGDFTIISDSRSSGIYVSGAGSVQWFDMIFIAIPFLLLMARQRLKYRRRQT